MTPTLRIAALAAPTLACALPAQAQQNPPITIDTHPFTCMSEPRFDAGIANIRGGNLLHVWSEVDRHAQH